MNLIRVVYTSDGPTRSKGMSAAIENELLPLLGLSGSQEEAPYFEIMLMLMENRTQSVAKIAQANDTLKRVLHQGRTGKVTRVSRGGSRLLFSSIIDSAPKEWKPLGKWSCPYLSIAIGWRPRRHQTTTMFDGVAHELRNRT